MQKPSEKGTVPDKGMRAARLGRRSDTRSSINCLKKKKQTVWQDRGGEISELELKKISAKQEETSESCGGG